MRIYTLILIAALAGCGKKKDSPPATTGSATPVAVADAASAGSGEGSADSAQAADVDVPTEVDFEDLAATEIDDKNVEAHVKAIEQELAQ